MGRPKKTNPKNAGRKLFDGKDEKDVILKLESAFAFDATIEEACLYADISEPAYYNWVKKNPQFQERFKRLRHTPVLHARKTVVDKLKDNYGNAMDYLSRKRKNEFSLRTELTGSDGKDLPTPILANIFKEDNVSSDNSTKKDIEPQKEN